jgi:ribose-phosphate pyrophosphokinase
MANTALLYFQGEQQSAFNLADLTGYTPLLIERHDFPDMEFKLHLPLIQASQAVIFHTLDHPNDKLIELLFAAKTARQLGVKHLTLAAPYLAYMRQDIAFSPGEAVSQRIIGELLASLFNAVITVDPHLHRISKLDEVIPTGRTIVVSAAPVLGNFVVSKRANPLLIGPDGESSQWISLAAQQHHLDYGVAQKLRRGDFLVEIELPAVNVQDRSVVLLDDIASSGRTLALAAKLLLAAGAKTVDVAVTHALFSGDAILQIQRSGVENIWSTDTVKHESNAVSILPLIASALEDIGVEG